MIAPCRAAVSVAAWLATAWLATGCSAAGPAREAPATPVRGAPTPVEVRASAGEARLPGCGICYAHNWQQQGAHGYGSDTSARSLERLRGLGVAAVSLTDFGWMPSLEAVEVRWDPERGAGERLSTMAIEAKRARDAGMQVMLKPHLWVRNGAWQAKLAPDAAAGGWPRWFDSYEQFAVAHARWAESQQIDWFVIGTELGSATEADPARWRALIARVREVYRGRVTYAANWDEAERVPFWDALDAIAVNFYAPLAPAPGAGLDEMSAEARRWLVRYEALANRFGRPLLLTEVGFMNRPGTAVTPHLWPEHANDPASAAGEAEQATAYRAILETFGRSPQVAGIYWWKWFTDPATDEEGPVGFSPAGRQAERVLEAWCRGEPAPPRGR
jgi:hypothetical protein